MKKFLALILTISMLAACGITSAATALAEQADTTAAFFVAPDGNDSADGSLGAPFATITKARDAIRELKKSSGLPTGGITVYVRGGTYTLTDEILFTEEDSGTAESPITYKAYPGEEPIISGGVFIPGKAFAKVSDKDVLSRLSSKARENVLVANVKEYGLTEFKQWQDFRGRNNRPGHLVFVGDKALDLARWPNVRDDDVQQYTNCGAVLEKGTTAGGSGPKWTYTDNRVDKWQDPKYAMVCGVFPHGWAFEYGPIEVDKNAKTVKMKAAIEYVPSEGSRYFYMNVLEELDTKNEYYLDIDTGMLYIWPDGSLRNTTVGITNYGDDAQQQLIHFNGAAYINLSGLTVTLSNACGIFAQASDHITINNCDVKNIGVTGVAFGSRHHYENPKGARGVWMTYTHPSIESWNVKTATKEEWLKYNVTNSTLMNSKILNCGLHNVSVFSGDRYDLIPGNNLVTNNEIRESGLTASLMGILLASGGVGNTFSHNTMSGCDGRAVSFCGNDLIYEYNDVSNALKSANDMGVFYLAGWDAELCTGTEIRYNYIHDVLNELDGGADEWGNGYNGTAVRAAVYNDNCQPFLEVHHNIIKNVPLGCYAGSNPENNWNNNLFIDVDYPLLMNINTYGAALSDNGAEGLNYVGYREFYILKDNKAWQEKYPQVNEFIKKYLAMPSEDRKYFNSDLKGNVSVFLANKNKARSDSDVIEFVQPADYRHTRVENNKCFKTDPGFVNYSNGDLSWKEDAEVFKTNPEMKNVDVKKMGVGTEETANKLLKSVALKIGTPNAVVFGKSAMVDSTNANVKPVIIDSRTLVPVRFISEAFGCNVGWDADTQTVTITKDGKTVTMQIGSQNITVDGTAKEIDVPAQIIESRTMVPLRALTESLGKEVFWDARGLIVISDESNFLNAETDKEIIDNMVRYEETY